MLKFFLDLLIDQPALGLKNQGTIEPNKTADFIGFKVSDYREILYNKGKIKPSFICKRGKVYDK